MHRHWILLDHKMAKNFECICKKLWIYIYGVDDSKYACWFKKIDSFNKENVEYLFVSNFHLKELWVYSSCQQHYCCTLRFLFHKTYGLLISAVGLKLEIETIHKWGWGMAVICLQSVIE